MLTTGETVLVFVTGETVVGTLLALPSETVLEETI